MRSSRFKLLQRGRVAEIISFHVADGNLQDLAFAQQVGEWTIGGFDAQMNLLADVFQAGVAHECAGQQTALRQNLKSVADAQHQPTEAANLLTDCMIGEK